MVKRVKAACICQTLHFMPKEDVGHDYAAKLVKEEVARYKKDLERKGIRYKLAEEAEQSDGSMLLKIIKQNNTSPAGNYLD